MTKKTFLDELMFHYPELNVCRTTILRAYELLVNVNKTGCKILVCGNGGSSSDADHFTAELMKSFRAKRPLSMLVKERLAKLGEQGIHLSNHLEQAIPVISLSAHTATMTAVSNDIGYEFAFAQQVVGYGNEGDVLIAITTSGKSINITNAIYTAKALGMKVICFTGNTEGFKGDHFCDVIIRVPSVETYRIQEYHLPIYHSLCAMIEDKIVKESEIEKPRKKTRN
ncbi:D-sedoheptulose 7-phosphate isomerase [Fictibacillus solisalsi]|uniref:D-sedoheptulose 7-phosphate isomerase n=1 Tax=Fictibacillus solisalsi TaxID=459525 RepID=A0A1H0BS69_9BACL|nr:SIS domain-containing protein [Fictibacillus solisalsi]SDN48514.1 D-sedoheptulose 7-phosphate isomerase [Fictibacillus solisalsi]